jgi:hypothetical protein
MVRVATVTSDCGPAKGHKESGARDFNENHFESGYGPEGDRKHFRFHSG